MLTGKAADEPAPSSVHTARDRRATTSQSPTSSTVFPPAAGPAAGVPAAVLRLEGPALDRLAEDVMQRIERRVRIERERRGM